MATYLNEDQVGTDATVIGYPNLLLCVGVTLVLGDGSLVGAHFGDGSREAETAARLKELLLKAASAPRWMYVTGNFTKHFADKGSPPQGKAALLGYTGPVCCFDTTSLNYRNGTFIEVSSTGPDSGAVIRYKRNEKMKYESTLIIPSNRSSAYARIDSASTITGSRLHRGQPYLLKR